MATKKDLVEAHAFSRRRLVTAFVSGAPGGREVEPVRPGRVLIGGVALSVLLLAGAAIAGFLIGRPPAGWLDKGSFIISKDTGEQYVVLHGGDDPTLQRVPNYVSAQLLLGEPELAPATVRDKYIREVRLGEDLGIEGAPASLPAEGALVDDGWTACTADGSGIKLVLEQEPHVEEVADSAFLVTSASRLWLITTAPGVGGVPGPGYRFEMPTDVVESGTVADRLGFGATDLAPRVSEAWLNLFRAGSPLAFDEFGITRKGQPARYSGTSTDLSDYRIGDLLVDPATGDHYLLGDNKPQALSDFAALVYDAVGESAVPLEGGLRSAQDAPDYPAEWPREVPQAQIGGEMCAVLHPSPDEQARVALAINPTGPASSADVPRGRHEVDVAPSGGAYVLSGSEDSVGEGSPYVIDTKGQKYALFGSVVPDYIGYGEVGPPVVPSTWLEFFERGVVLSTNAARRLPEDAAPPSDDEEAAES